MKTPVKFVAELDHVREVSLLGTADLDYWEDRLRAEGLVPAQAGGRARVLIIAASAKFKGLAFRELSFCVLAHRPGEPTSADGSYLIRAFNSSRLLAFCERAFFATPYHHGDVRMSTSPASIRLVEGGQITFHAEMRADAAAPPREPSTRGEDGWEGPVFLPRDRRGASDPGRQFFARIRGDTRAYPFLRSQDSLTIEPAAGHGVLRSLVDSHYVAEEWVVRDDAIHAKSKTVRRAAASASPPRA